MQKKSKLDFVIKLKLQYSIKMDLKSFLQHYNSVTLKKRSILKVFPDLPGKQNSLKSLEGLEQDHQKHQNQPTFPNNRILTN